MKLLYVSRFILFDETYIFISNVIKNIFKYTVLDYSRRLLRMSRVNPRLRVVAVARLTPEDVNFHDRTVFLLPVPPSLLSTAT